MLLYPHAPFCAGDVDDKRRADELVVEREAVVELAVLGKFGAVVRSDDYHRVVKQAVFFEFRHERRELGVGALDFLVVDCAPELLVCLRDGEVAGEAALPQLLLLPGAAVVGAGIIFGKAVVEPAGRHVLAVRVVAVQEHEEFPAIVLCEPFLGKGRGVFEAAERLVVVINVEAARVPEEPADAGVAGERAVGIAVCLEDLGESNHSRREL